MPNAKPSKNISEITGDSSWSPSNSGLNPFDNDISGVLEKKTKRMQHPSKYWFSKENFEKEWNIISEKKMHRNCFEGVFIQ